LRSEAVLAENKLPIAQMRTVGRARASHTGNHSGEPILILALYLCLVFMISGSPLQGALL
jgi:hypothetical protein